MMADRENLLEIENFEVHENIVHAPIRNELPNHQFEKLMQCMENNNDSHKQELKHLTDGVKLMQDQLASFENRIGKLEKKPAAKRKQEDDKDVSNSDM